MNNKFILILVVFSCTWAGCKKDFLEHPSTSSVTLDNYYNTAAEVNGSTGVLYNSVWGDWYDKAFTSIGDVLGGTVTGTNGNTQYNSFWNFNILPTDDLIKLTWRSCYKAAGNASVLIQNFNQKKAKVSDGGYLDLGIAEAKFLRAFSYFYIARTFGDVPIIDDPLAMTKEGGSLVPKYYQKDVLRFAIEDLKVAEVGLPETAYQAGRVTKYSAKGLMAKIYLYLKDYANAKVKAKEVIDYAAANPNVIGLDDFAKMFTSSLGNNNKESLFALQWDYTLGWNGGNRWMSYAAPQPLTKPGPTNGNGYSSIIPSLDVLNPATGWVVGDKRRGWSVMEQGFHRADWVNDNFPGGFTYDTTGTTSTTDFKIFTGTRSNILKYVVGPTRTSELVNGGGGTSSSICTYMLRYSDVLLIYAEAVLAGGGTTSDAGALAAFNEVRQRAGLTPVSGITIDDILRERKCEFAFEGDYWFDMQRQAFDADMQPVNFAKTKQLVDAQERGVYDANKSLNSQKASLTIDHLFLPIPHDETVADPKLLEAAVPYY